MVIAENYSSPTPKNARSNLLRPKFHQNEIITLTFLFHFRTVRTFTPRPLQSDPFILWQMFMLTYEKCYYIDEKVSVLLHL